MGLAVFSGMLVATILGVLIIPVLYVFIESIGKKKDKTATVENNSTLNSPNHD